MSPAEGKTAALNVIRSSLILTAYVLQHFESSANHFAKFEAWCSLAATLVWRARTAGLERERWALSLRLVQDELVAARSLGFRAEALGRQNFLEGSPFGDGGDVHTARALVTVGAVAAVTGHLRMNRLTDADSEQAVSWIVANAAVSRKLWGESSFPFAFHVIKLLEAVGRVDTANELVAYLLAAVVKGYDWIGGVPTKPMWGQEEALASTFGVPVERPIDPREFCGHSMILRPIVEWLHSPRPA